MGILEKVVNGRQPSPPLVLIYGKQGVGKTTFGAGAPKPIILRVEDDRQNDAPKTPLLTSYADVMGAIKELTEEKHDYQTAVLDSLTSLEELVWRETCTRVSGNTGSIESFGYGKGYVEALRFWAGIRDALARLRDKRGMAVVITAHQQVKKVSDPNLNVEYDKFQLSIHDKASGLWTRFVDAVLFAAHDVTVQKDKNRIKAFGDGERVVFTEERPGQDAKNRFNLPYKMKLSWAVFAEKLAEFEGRPLDVIEKELDRLIGEVQDLEIRSKAAAFRAEAAGNRRLLLSLERRLQEVTAAK